MVVFQSLILKYQSFKEKICENAIDAKDEKIIILYDRAMLDNKAYFENFRDFDYIMGENNKSEIEILDSYDIVLDLLSLATCKPEKYNLSSNEARKESPLEARILDQKTSAAWVGHRDMYLINSDVSVKEEFKTIKDIIDKKLSGKSIKNKETISINNTLNDFSKYNDNNSRLIDIESLYLNIKADCYLEIQKRTYKNKTSIVAILQDNDYIYSNVKIDHNAYLELINRYYVINTEKYKQLSFIKNKQLFDIKFYNNKTILEYEENKMKDRKSTRLNSSHT